MGLGLAVLRAMNLNRLLVDRDRFAKPIAVAHRGLGFDWQVQDLSFCRPECMSRLMENLQLNVCKTVLLVNE